MLLLAGFAVHAQQAESPANLQTDNIAAGEIGSRLPEFSIKDLQGHPISSADLKGKVVIIDFWATWWQEFELVTQFTTVHNPRDYLWIPYSRSNTRISGLVWPTDCMVIVNSL